MSLLPYQERVVLEKEELDKKLALLVAFTRSVEQFKRIPLAEQYRLTNQRRVMLEYSDILGARIAAFEAVETPVLTARELDI